VNEDLDLEIRARKFKDYLNENKKVKDILVWVWRVFISDRGKKILKQTLVLTFLASIMGVMTSYYAIKNILDGMVLRDVSLTINGFIALSVILVAARIINSAKSIRREYFMADFGAKLTDKVSRLFFEKSLGTHTSEDNLLNESNISKGCERLSNMINIMTIDCPDLVVGLTVSFVALWFVNSVVAFIITFMIIIHLTWSGFTNYWLMMEGAPVEKKWRFLNRFTKERWKNIERVKSNAKENEELGALNKYYDEAITLDLKLWIAVLTSWCKRGIFSVFIYVGALVYGMRQIWVGHLSPGFLYPMFALSTQIFDNLWKVGDLERKIHYDLWSVGVLKEALNLPVGLSFKANAVKLSRNSPCHIEFDSVSYRFNGGNSAPLVLSDILFTIEPNEKVAIIGTSGVGKSTLMKLLLRYMDPTSGTVRIDGQDLKEINLESWLSIIGYIPQTPQIWNDTIRGNALYGMSGNITKDISDEYLWKQARSVQVDFGERLTEGLYTRIGERGIKLSGGQNQRLMILAAIMKEPRFMVIDEATSSLDSSTEKLVQAGLERALSRNCGALVIAHRLSTVRRICDKFIVVEQVNGSGGKIVGMSKSFKELYENCPQFRKLADDQDIKI